MNTYLIIFSFFSIFFHFLPLVNGYFLEILNFAIKVCLITRFFVVENNNETITYYLGGRCPVVKGERGRKSTVSVYISTCIFIDPSKYDRKWQLIFNLW